eukprot:TRINITY_DN5019_c0_g1_i2.p1 TRINITY_DN5019_c0_g1~~TRINITY_DN5019_c0_g1_i2.p1  ORF type:complete len:1594 (-),score=222.29 TRINITY_DN5019_c0_g1_i2:236-5017(-)
MAEPMASIVLVHQGILGVKRKRGIESRHFMLYEDRMDYFKNEKEAASGADPRGRVNLEDIKSIETMHDTSGMASGLVIELTDQSLEVIAIEAEDMPPWIEKLNMVLDVLNTRTQSLEASPEVICKGVLGVERKGKAIPRYFILMDDGLEYYEAEEDRLAGKDPRGRVMNVDVVRLEANEVTQGFSVYIAEEKKPLELKALSPEDFKMWSGHWKATIQPNLRDGFIEIFAPKAGAPNSKPASPSSPQGSPQGATSSGAGTPAQQGSVAGGSPTDSRLTSSPKRLQGLLLDGPLGVVKKGRSEMRHVALWNDRFEYFNKEADLTNGNDPRCRVPHEQIKRLETSEKDLTMTLHLEDRSIVLQAADKQEYNLWLPVWGKVKVPQGGKGMDSPSQSEGPTSPAKVPPKSPRQDVGTPSASGKKQGELAIPSGSAKKQDRGASSPGPGKRASDARNPSPGPARRASNTRNNSPGPGKRPSDVRAHSPGPSKRPSDVRTYSPGPAKRPSDVRAHSPGPAKGPSDVRSPGPGRRQSDGRDQSPVLGRKQGDGRNPSPGPGRRQPDGRNQSPGPSRNTQAHAKSSPRNSGLQRLSRGRTEDSPVSVGTGRESSLTPGRRHPQVRDSVSPRRQSGMPWDDQMTPKEDASPSSVSVTIQDPDCIKAGTVHVPRNHKLAPRYMVVYKDHIGIFSDKEALDNGQDPRGYICRDDIHSHDVVEQGFSLTMHGAKLLNFRCEADEVHSWDEALDRLLSGHKDEETPGKDSEENLLVDGMVNVVSSGKHPERKYFRIFSTHFEYFHLQSEAAMGFKPLLSVAAKNVKKVEDSMGSFFVHFEPREQHLEIRVTRNVANAWSKAWSQLAPVTVGEVSVASSLSQASKVGSVKLEVRDQNEFSPGDAISIGTDQRLVTSTSPMCIDRPVLQVWPPGTPVKLLAKGDHSNGTVPHGSPMQADHRSEHGSPKGCEVGGQSPVGLPHQAGGQSPVGLPHQADPQSDRGSPHKASEHGSPSAHGSSSPATESRARPNGTEVIHEGLIGLENWVPKLPKSLGGVFQPKHLEILKGKTKCMLRFFEAVDGRMQKLHLEILVGDIRAFRVTDDGFIISTYRRDFKLKAIDDLDRWVVAFKDVFKEETDLEAENRSGSSPHSSARSSPRSPRGPPAANRSPPRTPRNRSSSPRRLPPTASREEDEWISGIEGMGGFSATQPAKASAASKPRWPNDELKDPHLERWLAALADKDPPVHHGLLGVQPQGKLVSGYFVLFRERLDFWNRPAEAATGMRPRGRIQMSDVRSIESVSTGLIMNYKGRKMGLHVRCNEDLQQWSNALLGVLAPSAPSRSRSATPTRTPRSNSAQPNKKIQPRAAPKPSAWLPRVALLAKGGAVPRKVYVDPEEEAINAGHLLRVKNHSPIRSRSLGPQISVGSVPQHPGEVAGKVFEQPSTEPSAILVRRCVDQEENIVGNRRVLTPPRGRSQWSKINLESVGAEAPKQGRRQTSAPPSLTGKVGNEQDRKLPTQRLHLTEKVTDAGKQPLALQQATNNFQLPGKVTDAGREGSSFATPFRESYIDKVHSMSELVVKRNQIPCMPAATDGSGGRPAATDGSGGRQ